MAVDLQSRAFEHGARWDHSEAEIGNSGLASTFSFA